MVSNITCSYIRHINILAYVFFNNTLYFFYIFIHFCFSDISMKRLSVDRISEEKYHDEWRQQRGSGAGSGEVAFGRPGQRWKPDKKGAEGS